MKNQLYPGIAFSPQVTLTDSAGAADTIIKVSDVSAFPEAPNLATIGIDEDGETILYTAKTEDALSGCRRGVEGAAKTWSAGEIIGRNFTAKDHNDLIENLAELETAAQNAADAASTAKAAADEAAEGVSAINAEKAVPGGVATLDADGKLTAAQRPSLAEIQGGSNPNLLINWDFRDPVNRNGLEQYPKGVNLDRWICDGEVTLNDGYITVGSNFYQIIPEQEASQYLGKQVTLSVLYHNGTLESGTITFPSAFPDTTQGINVPGTTNLAIALYANKRIQIFRLNGGPHEVVALKTELGAHQTLAWQNEEGAWELIDPPDYALQYALCCQYSPITGDFVGSQHSNENLLDNWYFANKDIIINQRNQIEYIGQFYTIDRWVNRGANTKITLQDDGIKYTFGVEIGGFNQSIENPKRLVGKTVTCSILVDENTNDSTLRFGLNAATSPYAHSSIICAVYIPAGATGLFSTTGKISDSIINDTRPYLNFGILKQNLTGSTLKIKAAKLELGSVQTLAHKEGDTWVLNDPPPNKALELTKCQRYQSVLTANGNNITIEIGRASGRERVLCSV